MVWQGLGGRRGGVSFGRVRQVMAGMAGKGTFRFGLFGDGLDWRGRCVLEGRVKVRFGMAGMVFEASPGAVSHGTARQVWSGLFG